MTRHKDELLVEYATYQMNSQLFVQKYQLYLPDREELRRQLERTLMLLVQLCAHGPAPAQVAADPASPQRLTAGPCEVGVLSVTAPLAQDRL